MAYQSPYSLSEQQVNRYVKNCGENGATTVVEVWLDGLDFLDELAKAQLQADLIGVLTRNLSALEVAQMASVAVEGPDYREWCKREEWRI